MRFIAIYATKNSIPSLLRPLLLRHQGGAKVRSVPANKSNNGFGSQKSPVAQPW
ncbi:hypothetical protein ACU8KH_01369 [Lachancea thermotolerans]